MKGFYCLMFLVSLVVFTCRIQASVAFDSAYAPFDSAHAPFDSAYAPFDSAHAPFDSAHAPFDSAHAPFDSAHAPFDSTRPNSSSIIMNLNNPGPGGLWTGMFYAESTFDSCITLRLYGTEKVQGSVDVDWTKDGVTKVNYPLPDFIQAIYYKPDKDLSSVLAYTTIRFKLPDSTHGVYLDPTLCELFELDTISGEFKAVPEFIDSCSVCLWNIPDTDRVLSVTFKGNVKGGTFAVFANSVIRVDGQVTKPSPMQVQLTPNPVSSETVFHFTLLSPMRVNLSIFDTGGRLIETFAPGNMVSGYHNISWQPSAHRNLPGGIYLYRLKAGNRNLMGKMILIR